MCLYKHTGNNKGHRLGREQGEGSKWEGLEGGKGRGKYAIMS